MSLDTNGGRVAFAAAVPFPLLEIEEKLPLAIALNHTTAPVFVQHVTSAGGDAVCEHCQFIVYKPITTTAPRKGPVIAYTSATPFDLSGAKRIVFFAKGELSGETVKVLAIGKPDNLVSTPPLTAFKFAVVSPDIVLTNNWKRYELNVDGLDLKGITTPFGLVISNQRGSAPIFPGPDSDRPPLNNGNVKDISFYLKGVSIDTTPAVNPTNIIGSQLTSPNTDIFILPFRP
ncbi:MAG TPA: hypothetical protein VFJ05_06255 [Nitrososphaeraceae archaeon]|nr:hypothetical protein [Nitrososphaeraceae archaeon]